MRARLACLLSLSTHCRQVPYLFKASFILGIYQSENRRRIYKSYRRMRRPTSYFENTGKKTSTFGLKSTTFIGAKVWNSLPNELRSTTILKDRIYVCCERTKFLMYSFFMVNCNSLKFEIFLILFFDIARMLVIN